MTLKMKVRELEISMIQDALQEADYSVRLAAKAIGLSYQGMLNKIERYKIVRPRITTEVMRCASCGYKIRVAK
jgi:Transcriptional regulator containing PAS, AAA-type ATPase, and DNA-binding domains